MVYCSHCGAPIPEGAKFCTSCGQAADGATVLVDGPAPTPPRPAPAYTPPSPPAYTPPAPAAGPDLPPPKGSRYAPVSTLGFVGTLLLLCIPLLNLVLLVVWALGGCRNVNRRNLARAILILAVVAIVLNLLLAPLLIEYLESLFIVVSSPQYPLCLL